MKVNFDPNNIIEKFKSSTKFYAKLTFVSGGCKVSDTLFDF